MGQVTATDGIAIWKLVFYTFSLIASLAVVFRHGLAKNSGWLFLSIFSTIRLTSAAAQISTISNPTTTAYTVAEITAFLGLSPLLLAALGLLSRLYFAILKSPWNVIFTFGILKAVQTPAAIALILCIVGATSADNPIEITSQTTVRAGLIVFLIVAVALALLTLGGYIGWKKTGRGEKRLVTSVSLSLPFFFVRLIYSLLLCFSSIDAFAPGSTSTDAIIAGVFMDTLMEMTVVCLYLWAGLTLRKQLPEERHSDAVDQFGQSIRPPRRQGRGGNFAANFSNNVGPRSFGGGGKLGLLGLVGGLVTAVREEMSQGRGEDGSHHYTNEPIGMGQRG